MPILHDNFYTGIFWHAKVFNQFQASDVTEVSPLDSRDCDVRKLVLDAGEKLCVAGTITERIWKKDLWQNNVRITL
jgi:hypothetical protein